MLAVVPSGMLDRVLLLVGVVGGVGCDSRPAPPFTYRLTHGTDVLFEQTFESYEAGKSSGPHSVTFEQQGMVIELVKQVGFCGSYDCAGPLELEDLALYRGAPDDVLRYDCRGLDGSVSGIIDVTRRGACQ